MRFEVAEELITRLNPKTQGLEMRVQGLQGGITAHDIAHAMRGADVIEEAIARYKFAGQSQFREAIIQWLWAVAIRLKDRERWHTSPDQHRTMAEIVLNTNIPDKLCPVCKGRKLAPNDLGKPDICSQCKGDGFIGLQAIDKAQRLGVKESAYYKTYSCKISQINQAFKEKDDNVIRKIAIFFTNRLT